MNVKLLLYLKKISLASQNIVHFLKIILRCVYRSLLLYSCKKKTCSISPFFSNGALDPWSAGGVTQNITDSLVAVLIEDGAHHLDLRHKNPLDPPSVVQARNIEKRYIAQWIKEYNERRKDRTHFRISSKRKFKNISIL